MTINTTQRNSTQQEIMDAHVKHL